MADDDLTAKMKGPDGEEHDITHLIGHPPPGEDDTIHFDGQEGLDVGDVQGEFTKLVAGQTHLPVYDKLSVTGRFSAARKLQQGERVLVQVVDGDGQQVGAAYCTVDVAFKSMKAKDAAWVEQRHTATVED